jgi:hypothetical protein
MLMLLVFLPVLCIKDMDLFNDLYSLIIVSRFARIMIFTRMISHYYKLGNTDVDR